MIHQSGTTEQSLHSNRAEPAVSTRHSVVPLWLKQPLIQFLFAGFALFVIYGGLHGPSVNKDPRRIEITSDDVRRIEISWLARWQREPTADEMRGMIDDYVKEEILYREALALGLDKNDEIIRRRLAQKMDFIAEDVANLSQPAPGQVEAWFEKNRGQFAAPPLVTFRHLYFASDKRGADAEASARKQLARLSGKDASGGDKFMYQDTYAEQTPDQVARIFGSQFASNLFQEKAGIWIGPLQSGYGWHLVWINSLTPSATPAFESVASAAKAEWLSEQRDETKRARFEALKARYEIYITRPILSGGNVAANPEMP